MRKTSKQSPVSASKEAKRRARKEPSLATSARERAVDTKKTRSRSAQPARKRSIGTEFGAVLVMLFGSALFLSLLSYLPSENGASANLMGPVGDQLSAIMLKLVGLSSFVFAGIFVVVGLLLLLGKRLEMKPSELVGHFTLLVGSAALFHVAFDGDKVLDHLPGGAIGAVLGELSRSLFSDVGALFVCASAVAIAAMLATDLSFASLARGIRAIAVGLYRAVRWPFSATLKAIKGRSPKLEELVDQSLVPEAPAKLHRVHADAPIVRTPEAAVRTDEVLTVARSPKARRRAVSSQHSEPTRAVGKVSMEQLERDAIQVSAGVQERANAKANAQNAAANRAHVEPRRHEASPEAAFDSSGVKKQQDSLKAKLHPAEETRALNASAAPEAAVIKAKIEALGKDAELSSAPGCDGDVSAKEKLAQVLSKLPRRKVLADNPRTAAARAVEPAYEFESIAPPEAIADGRVLAGWRPRSLSKPHTSPTDTQKSQQPARSSERVSEKMLARELGRAELATPNVGLAITEAATPRRRPVDSTQPVLDMHAMLSAEARQLMVPTQPGLELAVAPVARYQPSIITPVPELPSRHPQPSMRAQSPSLHSMKSPAPAPSFSMLDLNADDDEDDDDSSDAIPAALLARAQQEPTKPGHAESAAPKERPVAPAAAAAEPCLGPNIVLSEAMQRPLSERELEAAAAQRQLTRHGEKQPFQRPPLSLLSYDGERKVSYDGEHLREMADTLERKLLDYKVKGQVVQICPGPVVTRFEFLPAPGTKVATIANLADDLKMALEALSVRVIAPIPGKGVVGIEVPNEHRETVYVKEILGSTAFSGAKSVLTLALGKDIEGNAVVSDLAKMPHLLVAGSTGSGKSVAVNTMLCSLLYNATPEEVKLILVDPKRLELSIYNGIPHLLLPPITEPKKASMALRWAVDEMERRYTLMAELGVRNIKGYNKKAARIKADPKAFDEPIELYEPDGKLRHDFMPFIVIIIDELADLMMVAAKEVETSIARLAQMARACGIHLILATQRPSVDVLTGLIKANFPTRLAFKVFSRHDSKTILDGVGAEALLGMGDSLFLPPGTGQVERVHGAFISDEEVQSVVDFLRAQGEPEYNEMILSEREEDNDEEGGQEAEEYDEFYDQAVQIVTSTKQASISMLQRKLRVGYNRAARMIEKMEQEGIVGPSDGSKPREVLVSTY